MQIFMFGGLDALGRTLDDLWVATFTATSDGADFDDMTWAPAIIKSESKPEGRTGTAAGTLNGAKQAGRPSEWGRACMGGGEGAHA
jgi:hypothetical protein